MASRERKYPGRPGVRPDRKDQRREEAQTRQAEYDLLTDDEKVAKDQAWGWKSANV